MPVPKALQFFIDTYSFLVSVAKFLPDGMVKSVVGHSKNMDTFGVYGHLLNGEREETATEIGKLFNKILG